MKQLTAVEWLVNEIFAGKTEAWQKEINQALQMEKEQIEISDEEIDKQAALIELGIYRMFFKTGAKWYREQLKKKQ